VRRATCVPQEGVSNGHLGALLTTAGRRSRPGPGRGYRVPKLSIKQHMLLAGLCSGMDSVTAEHGGRWVTRGAGIPLRRRQRRSGIPTSTSVLRQADTSRVPLACH
jgi:hypothetical protein